ncbi:MAG: SH3 domain-containing protein [Lachnospiraceae bacterium]|nr:SH3 domain-containing protein [Lachnospiraceae bacterium]
MVQKKKCISVGRKHFFGLIAAVGVVSVLWGQPFVSLADSTGTVKADSANIREKADTNSDVIGSASGGTTVSIKDEVQDSSGTLWYQVYVNANTTGYIRADLVDKTGGDNGNSSSQGGDGQTASQGDSQPASGASGALEAPDNEMDAQYAVITAERVIVRAAPSTNEGVVVKLVKDDQVIVSGQSNGSDGKLWYYVTFTGENSEEKTGFIRSDLLSLGEMVPVPEEETPEPEITAPDPEPPVNNDYTVTYDQAQDVWYLHDYTSGEKQTYRMADIMRVTKERSESEAEDAKALVRQRIVIVVLIILLIISIALNIVMALKIRDVYYEEYEDEDEEQEEEAPPKKRSRADEGDETQVKRKNRAGEEEEASARRRRSRAGEEEEASARRRRSRADEEEEMPVRRRRSRIDEEETPQRRRRTDETEKRKNRMDGEEEAEERPSGTSQKRKTKNFLLDDDEFEFEFLNMDDKDL